MPRNPDPDLKDRILNVADRLLRRKGEKGLTLRAVAKAAGTTTPTVYKRFRNRAELMRALGNRERLRFLNDFDRSLSVEDLCQWYLEYASNHRHEYQLVYGAHWPEIFASEPREEGVEWAKEQLAKRYGGSPAAYDAFVRWLRLLLHGAGSLLVNAPKGPAAAQLSQQCLQACRALIADAKRYRQES